MIRLAEQWCGGSRSIWTRERKMATDDLTCRELVELVTEYLEGVLPPDDHHRFEAHLLGCRVCPRYVDQLRTTIRIVGRLREVDVPEPARSALLAAFRSWKTA
jgi:anti-sigma factor RsiW